MVIKCLDSGGGGVKRRSGGRLLSMGGGNGQLHVLQGKKK